MYTVSLSPPFLGVSIYLSTHLSHSDLLAQADFYMDNGTHVSNIVSVGPSGPEDLHMTFTFDIVAPEGMDIQAEKARTEKMALDTVQLTIQVIRGLVKEGKL